jgi:hypothetical protein
VQFISSQVEKDGEEPKLEAAVVPTSCKGREKWGARGSLVEAGKIANAEELKLEEPAAVPTLRLRSGQAFSQKRREVGHPILMLCKLFNLRFIVGS